MLDKPSDKEQEYFIQREMERIKQLRDEHRRQVAEEEREKLKALHYLHCAKCGQSMATTKLGSVEVEVCPGCGGMYLDAGELDKLVDEQGRERFGGALNRLRGLWGR